MTTTPQKIRLDAFISSTSIDLPEYRRVVVDALISLDIHPFGMEFWPNQADSALHICG